MKPAGRAATLSDLERNGADDDDATYDREDGWMLDARQPYPHRTQDVFQLGDQGHVDSRDEPRAQREENRPSPIWKTPSRASQPRLAPLISPKWANGANAANTWAWARHVAGAIDTSALQRPAITSIAANANIAVKEKTSPESPGRVGAQGRGKVLK